MFSWAKAQLLAEEYQLNLVSAKQWTENGLQKQEQHVLSFCNLPRDVQDLVLNNKIQFS